MHDTHYWVPLVRTVRALHALTSSPERRTLVAMQKWRMGGWLWGVLALLGGCGDTTEECLNYACANAAHLAGAIDAPPELGLVDVHFCSEGGCNDILVDVVAEPLQCVRAAPSMVCFRPSGSKLEVDASWSYGESDDPPKNGTVYELRLTNHETGEVLLDQAPKATFRVTREDNCHRCWSAEIDL